MLSTEISILNGVLELSSKSIEQIMTPIEDVLSLSSDEILDHKKIDTMYVMHFTYPERDAT